MNNINNIEKLNNILKWNKISSDIYIDFCSLKNENNLKFINVHLEFIKTTLINSNDINALTSIMQLISKSFKLNRSSSHPERLIGLSLSSQIVTNNDILIRDKLILMINDAISILYLNSFEKNFYKNNFTYELKYKSNYSYYFFLFSLTLDLLKEFKLNNNENNNKRKWSLTTENNINQDNNINVLYNILDLFHSIFQNDSNCCFNLLYYSPCCCKILDILKYSIHGNIIGNIDNNDIEFIFSKTSNILIIIIIKLKQERNDTNIYKCSFIDSYNNNHFYSSISILIEVFNKLLVINPPDYPKQSDTIVVVANKLIDIFKNNMNIILILKKLSEDDKVVITCLLNLTEIQLRLENIKSNDIYNNNEISTKLLFYNDIYREFQSLSCDISSLFIVFISEIINFDTTILIDLLSSPETPALRYILRVSKFLHVYYSKRKNLLIENSELVDLFSSCCDNITKILIDNNKNDAISNKIECNQFSFSLDKIIVLENKNEFCSDNNNNNIKIIISPDEFYSNKEHDIKYDSEKEFSSQILRFDIIKFIIFIASTFKEYSISNSIGNSLPFNSTLLYKRFKDIATSTANNKDLFNLIANLSDNEDYENDDSNVDYNSDKDENDSVEII